MPDYQVAIVGAGCAGLAARASLEKAGFSVVLLEARDRIGGRVLTTRDPFLSLPVELGAEFIHGRPPEIWDLVRRHSLGVYDCADGSLHIRNGVLDCQEDAWLPFGEIMSDMRKAAKRGRDESFAAFLEHSSYAQAAKERSTSFVEGFNAADKHVIGIASLAKDGEAADAIGGDCSFRLFSGYDSVPRILAGSSPVRLNTTVSHVAWQRGSVTLTTTSSVTGSTARLTARQAIITVPLGVLRADPSEAGAIGWDPNPEETLAAAKRLAFGDVMRVVLRFRSAFWECNSAFADAGFLISNEALFPAWWSPLWVRAPMLTGWSAGPHATPLFGKNKTEIVRAALTSLARILGYDLESIKGQLEVAHFHDWHSDRFARGAYSYVPAGAMDARETLARPLDDTLYFAGEATELDGHSATVHGAIAAGRTAAAHVIQANR